MQRDLLLISEMIDAASQAIALVGGDDAATISADRQRHEALLWNFTVLGEAASQLSEAFVEAHPGVPWRQPARLRNRIVHGYWSIDTQILCDTARIQLPSFVEQLRTVASMLDTPPE
jgi:uncharacterized protein with HEPN domain